MYEVEVFVKGNVREARLLRRVITDLPIASNKIARELAKKVASEAKYFAPSDTGNLRRAITWKKVSNSDRKSTYKVFLHKIPASSVLSDPKGVANDSQNVYPIAQETGYTPHVIRRGWAHPSSRVRGGGPAGESIEVSKFTPFMLPAKLKVEGKSLSLADGIINRTFDRLK